MTDNKVGWMSLCEWCATGGTNLKCHAAISEDQRIVGACTVESGRRRHGYSTGTGRHAATE